MSRPYESHIYSSGMLQYAIFAVFSTRDDEVIGCVPIGHQYQVVVSLPRCLLSPRLSFSHSRTTVGIIVIFVDEEYKRLLLSGLQTRQYTGFPTCISAERSSRFFDHTYLARIIFFTLMAPSSPAVARAAPS